ncbi:MAG TPA: helicase-associated domain-containing protein [Thermomicrobiales bacterium]|nr:helicase-associated domain-containing protein [Thermomicrobiales bacterium]
MERGVVRNLLGRLNARSPGDVIRIAERWQVPLSGTDTRRHVGSLYRTMTDIRAARSFYDSLTPDTAAIVRNLALAESGLRTLGEIAELIGRPEDATRDAAIWLFYAGVLAREGDRQELPVGAIPRLFLPRELEQIFTRVIDEIELGDMRGESLRSLFAILDESDIEEAARMWGMQVIPGLRGRDELSEELLRLMDEPERVRRVSGALSREGRALWEAVREASEADGGLRWRAAMGAAGLLPAGTTSPRNAQEASRILQTIQEVEQPLLIWHSYDNEGNRWLFVPHEIRHPGTRLRNLELEPLTPVPAGEVTPDPLRHPHAVAWDLLTVLRELMSHRSPVWQPGEPLARGWQRQVNGRLWFGGETTPPEGYLGFLLSLAHHAGLVEPGEKPVRSGPEKGAFRPELTDAIRRWRAQSFSAQTGELREAWLEHEAWIEGRERDELEVWGAHWPGVRRRLLEVIGSLEPGTWYRHRELAHHLAQQEPGLLGSSFTVASAKGGDAGEGREGRVAKVAQVIAMELETAFLWLGLVETGQTGEGTRRARTVRLSEAGRLASERPDVVPVDDAVIPGVPEPVADAPVLTLTEGGQVELHRPAPIHIWSLSAFSDQVELEPVARYELSKASLGQALGAGFDLDQVVRYLERQSGAPLSEGLMISLREWTSGYRRVRLRRVLVVQPDDPALLEDLAGALQEEGFELADPMPEGSGLRVYLPETGDDAAAAEDALQRALRANGFVGQWPRAEAPFRRRRPRT